MKQKEIFIVGGGPSLMGLPLSSLEHRKTIVINKSIFDVPSPSHFITMDFTFLHKIRNRLTEFQNINTNKIFVVNFVPYYIQEQNGMIRDTRSNMIYALQDFNMIVKSYQTKGFGYSFNDFRSGENTGYCALQLAILLGYRKIYLLGIDLNCIDKTHYHEGYGERVGMFNKKLITYLRYFKDGLKQIQIERPGIEVISCSPVSDLNDIIKFKEFDKCL